MKQKVHQSSDEVRFTFNAKTSLQYVSKCFTYKSLQFTMIYKLK